MSSEHQALLEGAPRGDRCRRDLPRTHRFASTALTRPHPFTCSHGAAEHQRRQGRHCMHAAHAHQRHCGGESRRRPLQVRPRRLHRARRGRGRSRRAAPPARGGRAVDRAAKARPCRRTCGWAARCCPASISFSSSWTSPTRAWTSSSPSTSLRYGRLMQRRIVLILLTRDGGFAIRRGARAQLHGGSRAVKRPLELVDDADGPRPAAHGGDFSAAR